MQHKIISGSLLTLILMTADSVQAVQVIYPSVTDFHTSAYVPQESAYVATFDAPQTPIRPPTIPPNAVHGLEHQNALVIPEPRPVTQTKIVSNTVNSTVEIIRPGIQTQTYGPVIRTRGVRTVVGPIIPSRKVTNIGVTGQGGTLMHKTVTHDVQPLPRGSFTRFITTIPVTSYSDELPVTVTITVGA